MPRKKKKIKTESKYLAEAIAGRTTVSRIESLNIWTGSKYKTVFYVPSTKTESKERMCIVWGRTTIRVGDTVSLTGRIANNVFLVWNLLILKREEPEEKAV